MNLSENAKTVLRARYLKEGETPEQRFIDVANHVATGEEGRDWAEYAERFYTELLEPLVFLPNTPCIANAGRKSGQLNACFVLPVMDSLTTRENSGIMDTARNAALIHQTGGGTGFDFSRLRPAGSPVASSNGVASGPVTFMAMYDAITNCIKQGGIRRGANMGILRIDHPDVREFIHAKSTQDALTNFNISVAMTDDFMQRVQDGDDEARVLWSEIYNAAWKFGDPGLFFVDRANEDNPLDVPIRATNPCGEIPMPDNDACNLGSIDLSKLVENGVFQLNKFVNIVHLAIRFLDDVVSVNKVPVPAIEEFTQKTRRLGLGVMGWADFLNKMGVAYDTEEALDWAHSIGRTLRHESDLASARLASEKGAYPLSRDGAYRNVARRSIQPTGSTAIIADCSPSIEPHYDREATHEGPIGKLRIRYPFADAPHFRTAGEVDPSWHVLHQATWQRYIDNGVSKTVNMNNTATPEDVRATYELAWKLRCKGITIYRDGSRDVQVYNSSKCIDGACEVPTHQGVHNTPEAVPAYG